ncbi:hypothetical protein LCM20_13365 [Halobacillus litoralis]|uniref:hypothetical protein n=1 Tax=Halobacillus litoralis TaxID=45668 RepID=UPI001CD7F56F|nr:hypothetical protein [Halobacillus litoralis]MCA0971590.1 hypothetical protein [Halobacillus litoralis]
MDGKCHNCHYVYERLKQQEETIAQLVQIIASTNQKVVDLHKRQMGVEHQILREQPQPFSTSS